MKPENIIKSIVHAIKAREELASVTCVYSDTRDIAQNPVSSFTLCMGLGRIKYIKTPDSSSPEFLTSVKLSLLAPSGAGGKRLTEVAMWITEAIREELNVSLIEVTEPRYIDTSSTLYCDITVTVEEVSLADTSCEIYLDSIKAQGIISYEIESANLYEKEPQLLNGYTWTHTDCDEYVLKFKTENALKATEVFELKLVTESLNEIYKNCRVKKVSKELTKWGNLSFIYEISAESCEVQND